MKKYRVIIPRPSAKRLLANACLTVVYHEGFDVCEREMLIQCGENPFETYSLNDLNEPFFDFEVPSKYEWIHSDKILDGWYFKATVKYTNSTGSRTESFNLVPQGL